ncbi:NUDIX domain-containing protein [Natronoglycomyces albus]|uniref:NUDIX hydrolase n=1 Tax=Natronoglycomyces albus TaxID=2811108 RepID=A0A895XKK8_9ACTN|nr:NUDIX hydrolase [Natronoglycomyces albus]QSB03959.1 NUDIX hydrolase [Natronoglycomyces albus]
MRIRVRALIHTGENNILTIKRTKPGQPPYWVLPGGHVEPTDASLEQALIRELREELGNDTEVQDHPRPVFKLQRCVDEVEIIYALHMPNPNTGNNAPSGPEFTDPSRGGYGIDIIPTTYEDLRQRPLLPPELKNALLQEQIASGTTTGMRSVPERELPTIADLDPC